ncbi:MAG TPA: hypothetical protein VJU83_12815 [Burkholderiales bacterium]|nr:hypothetical protein [Burkholderiales bacterium]
MARSVLEIDDLRTRLLEVGLEEPIRVTARGTLFPSALLTSGWWEKQSQRAGKNVIWHDKVQAWLFHGFEVWGPSWDFTFDLENWKTHPDRPYFVAQLGEGDEANSIPIFVPREKAKRIVEHIAEEREEGGWFGFEAKVTGLLSHRRDFHARVPGMELEMFGGLLDYCIWLDEADPRHCIEPLHQNTEIYSGYLWKCVMPKTFLRADGQPRLQDAYFLWEHTNFANLDAVAYNLDSLEAKERYLEQRRGELILVQKSSELVPGKPNWSSKAVYQALLARAKKRF